MESTVLLFYKYVTIEDPETVATLVRALAKSLSLTGRVLIATEGINATLEGLPEHAEKFVSEFLADKRFADISVKRSVGDGAAFPKLSVKVRTEIVGTRFSDEDANPRERTAKKILPEELREMYEKNDDFVVLDMRNDYEYKVGHFKDSVNPGLASSRDLPDALPKLEQYKGKKIVTVCTGGIRCEKMSAYLLSKGFEDVRQLHDGMHGYMEKFPGKDFNGSLYTFDQRTTMNFGGNEIIGRCMLCESPSEKYVNCVNDYCHKHFIACDSCQEEDGTACSAACREAVNIRVLESAL
jgi:UPF0176 protein